jgi:6-phosphogluconolactonase/glucosamine-6-phosphate isomerase/deaminase
MQFIHCEGTGPGVAALSQRLVAELASGKRVLWLVCGGSNIAAEVEIMKTVPADLSKNLTVSLTDERYGAVGHKDSNWQQLLEAGFDIKSGKGMPVLSGGTFEQTVTDYAALAKDLFEKNDIVIALFGIGADGHIAGILPDSPAADETTKLAAGYDNPPYTRLTLTFPGLKQIDVACAIALGDSKKQALQKLRTQDIKLTAQPSQILKKLPEAYLYSDQIEGETS